MKLAGGIDKVAIREIDAQDAALAAEIFRFGGDAARGGAGGAACGFMLLG